MQQATHWVMDYETIVNCFVAVFQHYKDDSVRKVFVINKDQNDFADFAKFLNECKTQKQWHISYNGLEFDSQITEHVIRKYGSLYKLSGEEIASKLYEYAQDIISRKDRGEFVEYPPFKLSIRQIDLFKLNHWDNRAKMSSLKWIQYAMDWENVEEMPHHHTQPVATKKQLLDVISYCINDVLSTKQILEHSKEQIKLRQALTKEYDIDLYSASEPRISKELFLYFLQKKTGIEKAELKRMRTPRTHIVLGDVILPYVQFQTPEFQKVLEFFRKTVITSTKDGFKFRLDYKGVKTDYGLGGIHGATAAGVYEAQPGWTIITSDVVSFYPNLAIKNRFSPEHLPKEEFLDLYEWVFEERKKIPKSDPKNYVYKIILNSTYGLTGDENSFLYDPRMTMQITVNGQLLLSMLYEMLSLAIPEAVPLMQNTDGLEMMIPTSQVETYMKVCAEWEKLTKLSLEHDSYQKMIIRDVNNYIAIFTERKAKEDPKEGLSAEQVWKKLQKNISYKFRQSGDDYYYTPVKCKGAFEWEDLYKKKVATLHKNKSFLIIPKAIHAYFVNGIHPDVFVECNKEVMDYCAGVKSKGAWYYEERYVDMGTLKINKLQKIVRYYVSSNHGKIVKCHPDGREIQVESGSWLQTVVNHIDPAVPIEKYDINYSYYLDEINKQIEGIEIYKPKAFTQLLLF